MIRVLFYIILALSLAFIVFWLQDNSGTITINWLGYEIRTSVWVALVIILLVIILLKIISLPFYAIHKIAKLRNNRIEKEKYTFLIDYLTALNSNEKSSYKSLAKRAISLFSDIPQLENLLLLNISFGDKREDILNLLLEEKDTELLAYKHKIEDALKVHKTGKALELYRETFNKYPSLQWIVVPFINLLSLFQNWTEIETVLQKALKHKAIDKKFYKKALSDILTEKALVENNYDYMQQAVKLYPDNQVATLNLATMAYAKKDKKKALAILQKLWKKAPSLELYNTSVMIVGDEPPLESIKTFARLLKSSSDKSFNDIVMANLYTKANLFGQARALAEKFLQVYPTSAFGASVMAEIENRCNPTSPAAIKWTAEATDKKQNLKGWVCNHCGASYNEWHITCPHCHTFGSINMFLGAK